ncbi:MAG TPA: nucleotide sugar dehydrogenase [Anaerohalosphaeraceae bacterium]|nr:nucleotide sugar dehydrogenase [Anaerohalosphaeraceae bacterium]HOT72930.1 nucleotide sugar dehydrogenase [Anaerohalosphaeraceae bacterium]HPB93923.1 nucleotide sugar dehydrogenase [Anaerohalosphaeraceae bacterium]HQJ67925.1 nucleotide sugar dehydrogenase [Anaerohalosphaeraceae bacterium]HRT24410.1 nucleotide sugar dehydrogenase [Anaerohalosphaeraceae bacterium]
MSDLEKKIASKKVVVGVLGLGYVGLPLAREFALSGVKVLGFDIDDKKVKILNSGRSIIKNVPNEVVRKMVKSGKFTATSDMSQIRKADAVLICVPTPLTENREPDMQYVEGSCRTIAKYLRKGHLISLESTTYPGTTRELMKPILEETGLKAGKDFYLAFSPEREDPGNKQYSTRTIPKVVGGLTPKCRQLAYQVYSLAIEKMVPVSSVEAAEATKILENVYRCINIAMVNELKMVFDRMGIDVWEVIRAASTKPFGYHPFYPGPGLGGHCIPIDPFYLTWKARQYGMATRFIELAGEINTGMPHYVVNKVMEALNERKKSLKGSKVLVLGLAYKPDIDDVRESPSLELIELLKERGAKVDYNDPYVPRTHKMREYDLKMTSRPLSAAMLRGYDCVLISTNHSTYDYEWIVRHSKLVVDTRNATAGVKGGRRKIVKA